MSYSRLYGRVAMFESNPHATDSTPVTAVNTTPTDVTAMPGTGYVTDAKALMVRISSGNGLACTVPVVGSPTEFTCTTPDLSSIGGAGAYRLCLQNPDGAITSVPWTAT